ncbi:MAG: hypothetical protein JKY54_11605 [Flavobacteriales bacterium]|nr:hypothetical protein [Flavobacteriales bacterium]
MNIIGKWNAYYEYGPGYDLPYFGERVHHEVFITPCDSGFEGVSKNEIGELSINQVGKIEGLVDVDYISFVKIYPVYSEIGADHKTVEDPSRQLTINYQGYVDLEFSKIYGNWTIITVEIDQEGNEHSFECYGIWMWERPEE